MKIRTKRYSPVLVKNPTSELHLVRLKPRQDFVLRVDDWFGIVDMTWTSEYFTLADEQDLGFGAKNYTFKQKFDLSHWSKVSNVYLGEVILIGEQVCCSLCVILDSNNHQKSFLTIVINPIAAEIKLEPSHILEVVLFDSKLGEDASWDVEIIRNGDIGYHCIGQRCLQTQETIWDSSLVDDVYFVGNRQFGINRCVQHHFWFRCDSAIFNSSWGVIQAGSLVFSGFNKDKSKVNISHQINVCLNVKSKSKFDYRSFLIPKHDEHSVNMCKRLFKVHNLNHFVRPVTLKRIGCGFGS